MEVGTRKGSGWNAEGKRLGARKGRGRNAEGKRLGGGGKEFGAQRGGGGKEVAGEAVISGEGGEK